jgi:hypothetical protein
MSTTATPQQLNELRLKLQANGYHPVPVVGAHVNTNSAGKRPTMKAWETRCLTADAEEIARWPKSYSNCTNTGILGGHIVGVDIDVLDEALSAKFVARALELFGPTSLRRIGRAPKTLLLYRVADPIAKLQTAALLFGDNPDTKADTDKCKVEILAEGEQFVAYGIHPDTRAPYHWPDKSPLDIPFTDVPLVTLQQLKQFVAESEATLRTEGARTMAEIKKAKKAADKASEEREATVERETENRAKQGYAGASGGDFFKQVNARAIASLSSWVPALFPAAKPYQGGYRVASKDLGRDMEEDLSILPIGIKDWGVADQGDDKDGRRTSIDVVKEWANKSVTDAALWLCEKIGIDPKTLGWKTAKVAQRTATTRSKDHITPEDFQAYLPDHKYIFVPTRALWSVPAVNSQLGWIGLFNDDGTPMMHPDATDKEGNLISGKQRFVQANEWLDQYRAVEMMTWSPGDEMLIQNRLMAEGGWFQRKGATCFNLYRPPTIKLGDPAKAQRWVDHVHKVFPDHGYADHIIKWLAHHVQHPEIKVNHSLVIGGQPGVGKDTMLAPAVQAVGPWNCSEVSPENLFEAFNPHIQAVLMRVSEARDIGDVSKFQLYEKTKTLGAAPPDTLRVNQKYMPAYELANVVGVIITTNYKTDGIYLPADDRRHYVCWSDVEPSVFDSSPGAGDASKYFDSTYRWYEKEGGYEDIAAYLRKLDLSDFNPKAPPPKTPAFWAIVDAGRAPEESEIADVLDRMNHPPAITIGRLADTAGTDLENFLRDRKNRKTASFRIAAAGYEVVRNDAAQDGMWVVQVPTFGGEDVGKRQTIYALSSLSVADRVGAAQQLADGKLWFVDRWLTPAEFAAATAEAAKEQARAKLAAERAATIAAMDAKAGLEREAALVMQ